jgi:uncharacterized cupin superfamily protein
MPKIDIDQLAVRRGSSYPEPFAQCVRDRARQVLGDAGGLTDFGVNLLRLPPGAWSSQRHWHSHEDEFVYVLSGELVLITDTGEQVLRAGDAAAFPKNHADGHHLVNRSNEVAVCLEVGSRSDSDVASYPDIDLRWDAEHDYAHKDGRPYPKASE